MEPIATRTLAEIYLRQGYFQKAFEIFKALAEKDPSDPEIQKRVKELSERLNPSPSREEKIRHLEKWLSNIRERKRV